MSAASGTAPPRRTLPPAHTQPLPPRRHACLRSTFERNGASVVVDDVSLDMLRGATVDFEMEMVRQGFVVLNNPNAESGCGCGVSFGLKEDDF